MRSAYYNEIDPKAAAWLRELIKQKHIADGEVDERDIQDVRPADLHGFAQCHFFAGIGVWSYALRRSGWPDDRPVWTGSCPCQPFSSAGKGGGFDDERHLWPSFHWLIAQCRPAVVFGEQVASKDAEPWLDLVQADLEALAYAVGAIPFPSAGIGAPHIRDRLYWVADAMRDGAEHRPISGVGAQATVDRRDGGVSRERLRTGLEGAPVGLADSVGERRRLGQSGSEDASDASISSEAHQLGDAASRGQRERRDEALSRDGRYLDGSSDASSGLGHAERVGAGWDARAGFGSEDGHGSGSVGDDARSPGANDWPGPVNGLWRDADWLYCRDDKWRPVEPGTFPLAHGSPARVGRLRGYGNAINAEAAVAWIEAYLESSVRAA